MKLLNKTLSLSLAMLICGAATSTIKTMAVDNQYKEEVFGDVGLDTNSGERTRNTGYNNRVRSARFNNLKYDSIPVLDCTHERIGLDWAGYSYYGGRHYSTEAFRVLKQNGCDYVLLYLGISPWNSNTTFKSNNCTDYCNVLPTALANAKEAGVKIGLIWEGNAVNTQYAFDEADYVCKLIKDYNLSFDLPLFYAPEYSTGAVAYENRTDAVKSFFSRLSHNGYTGAVGLYTNGSTNQGASIDANEVYNFVPNLCLWVPAYDNFPRNNPNFDNILYMHQYTGDYGVVPAREHTMINGVGYMTDISMAFARRPGTIDNIYIDGHIAYWNSVSDASEYKVRVVYDDFTYDEIITNDNIIDIRPNAIKVYVKALKTDKFGFTADSYNWAEATNQMITFDFDTIDLSEYDIKNDYTSDYYVEEPVTTIEENIVDEVSYKAISESKCVYFNMVTNMF